MSRAFNYTLRPAKIETAKPKEKPYPLTDGGGLYLDILPSGTKVWRYKFHHDGKRDKVTIGQYPAIGIKDARDEHERLRAIVAKGENPKAVKAAQEEKQQEAESRNVSFEAYARKWVAETLYYRSATYRAQMLRWLESFVFPAIGAKVLTEVKPKDILVIIDRLRDTPTTADGVRSVVQRIYGYAIRNLVAESNPAMMVRGAIDVPPRTHHKHLREKELAEFWRALPRQGAHFGTLAATKLLFYTMVRKSELIRARWPEFDLEACVWDIPADRMKMRRPHRVYLSTQAVDLLKTLQPMTGHKAYVFPSIYAGRETPMADVTLNHFFKRIDFGVSDFSPHGIRGTTATLLREHGIRSEVVELLLSHGPKGQVESAYNHAELGKERREALQFLADYLDQLAAHG